MHTAQGELLSCIIVLAWVCCCEQGRKHQTKPKEKNATVRKLQRPWPHNPETRWISLISLHPPGKATIADVGLLALFVKSSQPDEDKRRTCRFFHGRKRGSQSEKARPQIKVLLILSCRYTTRGIDESFPASIGDG